MAADTITGSANGESIDRRRRQRHITPAGGNDRVRFTAGVRCRHRSGFDANPTGGQDTLDITSLDITAATFNASVTIAAGPVAGSTRVTIGANTITLLGVAPATVTVADFNLTGVPLAPLSFTGVITAGAGSAEIGVAGSQPGAGRHSHVP